MKLNLQCNIIVVHLLLSISLFLYCAPNTKAQDVDSVLSILKKHPQNDTTKVKLLSDLAYMYHLISPDSTLLLSKQAFAIAQKLNYPKGEADALKHWAIGSYMSSEYKHAISRNEQALAIYKKLNDKKGSGAVLNNIAIIRHNEGDFKTAIELYQQSLTIRKEINDKIGIAACYNNIGNTYSDMGNYSEALYYLYMALRLREQLSLPQLIEHSHSNIANVYYYLGKDELSLKHALLALDLIKKSRNLDGIISVNVVIGAIYQRKRDFSKALSYFQDALEKGIQMGNVHDIGLCYNNIGEVYLAKEEYAKAKTYFSKALNISSESNDKESIAINNIGLGKAYLKTNRIDSAIYHLLNSYNISKAIGSKLQLSESNNILAQCYEAKNDFKNATLFYKQYILYKDSLFNDEVNKKSSQIEFDFILEKKQNQITLLQKDKSIQQAKIERVQLIIASMAVVLLLIIVFTITIVISFNKVKKANEIATKHKEEIEQQSKELKELNQLKDKILSVLSHDLRSPVASLSGIMSLLDDNVITPEEFLTLKKGMNNQLTELSLLLDNLLHWSRNQLLGENLQEKTVLSLPNTIQRNINLLKESAKQKNIELVLNSSSEDLAVLADRNQIDIVLRNLISNAIKFTHREGKISITIEDKGIETLTCISDNGVGMSEEHLNQLFNLKHKSNYGTEGEKGTGLGLLLCKDFITQNNGTLTVKSSVGVGSIFCITLPKA